jgi:hypothetical protein
VLFLPLEGSVEELSGFPSLSELLVSSFDHAGFQRSVHAGDNDVAQPLFVEGLDDVFVVETPSSRTRVRVDATEEGSLSKTRLRKSQAPEEAWILPALSSMPKLKPWRPSLEMIGA